MRQVYLDHQTTTPVLPEAWAAMAPFFAEHFGSAASLHRLGLRARDALAQARQQFARLLHAEAPEDILFTSGATEALNLAVQGAAYAGQRRGRHLVATAVEHPAVLNSLSFLESQGFTATRVPVNALGQVEPEAIAAAIRDETVLICVQHANLDLGTIQPVGDVIARADQRGIPVLVDATASGGWMPIDVSALGAGLLVLSPHRFYGPKGVGVLYKNRRTRLSGILHGGSQENGLRAGTENVPAIVGAGVAADAAGRELSARGAHVARLQRALWDGLRTRVPQVRLHGPEPGPQRLPTNLNLSFEGVEGEGVALAADLQGIAMASGAACVTQALEVSPALLAIGVDRAVARGNVILSLGKDNTDSEIGYVLEKLPAVVSKLRRMSPGFDSAQPRANG